MERSQREVAGRGHREVSHEGVTGRGDSERCWCVWCAGEYTEGQKSIAVLTTLDRTAWWRIRKDHFSYGINRESLHTIESAIIFVSACQCSGACSVSLL